MENGKTDIEKSHQKCIDILNFLGKSEWNVRYEHQNIRYGPIHRWNDEKKGVFSYISSKYDIIQKVNDITECEEILPFLTKVRETMLTNDKNHVQNVVSYQDLLLEIPEYNIFDRYRFRNINIPFSDLDTLSKGYNSTDTLIKNYSYDIINAVEKDYNNMFKKKNLYVPPPDVIQELKELKDLKNSSINFKHVIDKLAVTELPINCLGCRDPPFHGVFSLIDSAFTRRVTDEQLFKEITTVTDKTYLPNLSNMNTILTNADKNESNYKWIYYYYPDIKKAIYDDYNFYYGIIKPPQSNLFYRLFDNFYKKE